MQQQLASRSMDAQHSGLTRRQSRAALDLTIHRDRMSVAGGFMGIARILVMVLLAMALLPRAAVALPRSYAQEHPAYCAEAWEKKDTIARSACASRAFCDAHRNDDRISRLLCDPYVSKADRKRASITISRAFLDA